MTNADMPTAGRPAAPVDVQLRFILDDADYARRLAIEALQNGRVELGVGFANLALRATRAAGRWHARANQLTPPDLINVPLIGATRDEQPRESVWAAAHRQGHHEAMWVEKCELCPDEPRQCPDEHQPPHAAGSHPADCATCWKTSPPHNDRPVDLLEYRSAHSNVETATTQPPIPPVSSRCTAYAHGFDREPCGNVIYLENNTGVWCHLNRPLDTDHKAIPREGDGV